MFKIVVICWERITAFVTACLCSQRPLRTETMKNGFCAINVLFLFSPLDILCLIPFAVVRYKFHTLNDGTRKQAVVCKEALAVLC